MTTRNKQVQTRVSPEVWAWYARQPDPLYSVLRDVLEAYARGELLCDRCAAEAAWPPVDDDDK